MHTYTHSTLTHSSYCCSKIKHKILGNSYENLSILLQMQVQNVNILHSFMYIRTCSRSKILAFIRNAGCHGIILPILIPNNLIWVEGGTAFSALMGSLNPTTIVFETRPNPEHLRLNKQGNQKVLKCNSSNT